MPGFLRRHRLPLVIAIAFLVVVGVAVVVAQPRGDGVAQTTGTPTVGATHATASGSESARASSRATPDASGTPPGTPGFTPGTSEGASPSAPTAAPTGTARPATPAPTAPPPPPPAATAVLVGAGDIANCSASEDEATADLLDGIPGTVFTLGDNVYDDGTAAEFNSCYAPNWGRHKWRTRPAPGNHDYHVNGAAGYFGYFGANAGPAGAGYYAYNLGGWRIYSLNSEIVSPAEVDWLTNDLARNPSRCILAYWHHPRYSSQYDNGKRGDDNASEPFWVALEAAGAELVLNGHMHHYERMSPIRGITEVIVGTGGTGTKGFGAIRATSVKQSTDHGVLKLTLSANGFSGQFIPIAGQSFTDSFSGTCH